MSPRDATPSNNFKKLQAQLRGSVGKAIADYRHDRRRRSRDGVPVGRQGFLHACSTCC